MKLQFFVSKEGIDKSLLHVLKSDRKYMDRVGFIPTPWPRFPETHDTYIMSMTAIHRTLRIMEDYK